MSSFTSPLDIRFHSVPLKEKPFELLTDFSFYYGENLITAPKGYRTDFASIPRFFQRLMPPIGTHGKAAVIHDIICDNSIHFGYTYLEAADIFDEGMKVLGVKGWRRKKMVQAVKRFGPRF